MDNFNLKTYINITITEKTLKDFRERKRGSRNGSMDSFEDWCNYIQNLFRNTRKISDDFLFIIIPIVKELAHKYGLNNDESLTYVSDYFKNELWNKYKAYTFAKIEYHGM